jgi:uncharacterized protein YkwD
VTKVRDILACQQSGPSYTWVHNACGLHADQRLNEAQYAVGCRGWAAAENVYHGSGRYGSARAAVTWWMHSEGHRNAILDPRFRQMGIWSQTGTFQGQPDTAVWVLRLGVCG